MQKKLHDLSDPYIEAAIDFQEGSPLLLSDKQVKGPQLRIGEPSTLGNSIMRKKTTAGGCTRASRSASMIAASSAPSLPVTRMRTP